MDGYNHGFYRGPSSMHTQGLATSTSDGSGRQTSKEFRAEPLTSL